MVPGTVILCAKKRFVRYSNEFLAQRKNVFSSIQNNAHDKIVT